MIRREGPGWRLVRDSSRRSFPVMIGGESWAVELSEQEWKTLIPVIDELINQHKKMENQLMAEESICLEIERLPWWGCLDGDKCSWSLQLIREGNEESLRRFEAYWPFPAAQSITCAMKEMWDLCQ